MQADEVGARMVARAAVHVSASSVHAVRSAMVLSAMGGECVSDVVALSAGLGRASFAPGARWVDWRGRGLRRSYRRPMRITRPL